MAAVDGSALNVLNSVFSYWNESGRLPRLQHCGKQPESSRNKSCVVLVMASFTILMVAEKPSICTSVAEALYRSNHHPGKPQSRNKSPPVYEFDGRFQGRQAKFRITSVTGHLFSLDFPSKYQNWDQVDPLDLFSAPTVKSPEGKGGIIKHLEREARGVDALILWMDCDREGENICFEVINSIEKVMKRAPNRSNIYRARFSAVTQKDIEKAMLSLVAPNENESKAVDARQELDLKVGVAFSRFQTRFFQGKYGDLDSSIISYGPCQTPTLGFCVARHDEIQHFVSQKFWTIKLVLGITLPGTRTMAKLTLNHEGGRIFKQHEAERLQSLLSQAGEVKCIAIAHKDRRRVRPLPMNTVGMLKLASQLLGIGPHAAMRAAEHLYLAGYLSYPRTESTAYPVSHDMAAHRETLTTLLRFHPQYRDHVQQMLTQPGLMVSPRAGVDKGDHPPISPVGEYFPEALGHDEQRLYDMICGHYLATISRNAVYQQTKARFTCTIPATQIVERFNISTQVLTEPGFMALYHRSGRKSEERDDLNEYEDDYAYPGSSATSANSDEFDCFRPGANYFDEDYAENSLDDSQLQAVLNNFTPQGVYPVSSVSLNTGKTSPPGYLTEANLIDLMEKNGIGTDASIPVHINNILTRNYVTLQSNRTLVPTKLGIVLVHGYHRIDAELVLPQVRAAIEKHCSEIALGRAAALNVVQQALAQFTKKFTNFREHIGWMDSLFEASFSPLAQSGKALSRCGKCLRYMRYIPLNPQRLYCPTCEETYALPQGGTIKLYKELKCPLDNFDLVLFSLGNGTSAKEQGKSYSLCPCCYSRPPKFKHTSLTGKEVRLMLKEPVDEDEDDEEEKEKEAGTQVDNAHNNGGRQGGAGGRGRGGGDREGRGGAGDRKAGRGGGGRGDKEAAVAAAPTVAENVPIASGLSIPPAVEAGNNRGGRGRGRGRGGGRGEEEDQGRGRGEGGRGRGKGGRGGGRGDILSVPTSAPSAASTALPQPPAATNTKDSKKIQKANAITTPPAPPMTKKEKVDPMEALMQQFELLDIEDLGSSEIVVDTETRGQSGHMGCNSCIHPICRHSLTFSAVCACPDEHCDGVLVLDVNSKPHWKVACNTCSLILRFKGTVSAPINLNNTSAAMKPPVSSTSHHKKAGHGTNTIPPAPVEIASTMIHHITVEHNQHCPDCGDRMLCLELHRDYKGILYTAALQQQQQQENGAVSAGGGDGGVVYRGCVLCDTRLQSHIDMISGRAVSLVVLRQQRERRKKMGGRGRGGRGRGRGGRGGRGGKRMTKDQILMSFSDF